MADFLNFLLKQCVLVQSPNMHLIPWAILKSNFFIYFFFFLERGFHDWASFGWCKGPWLYNLCWGSWSCQHRLAVSRSTLPIVLMSNMPCCGQQLWLILKLLQELDPALIGGPSIHKTHVYDACNSTQLWSLNYGRSCVGRYSQHSPVPSLSWVMYNL